MTSIESLYEKDPFSFTQNEKNSLYGQELRELSKHHFDNCPEYRKIIKNFHVDLNKDLQVEDYPYLPVRLFKQYKLSSVANDKEANTLTSSGTSGQQTSKITLDADTSKKQKKVLSRIVTNFLGQQRLPMLVLDSKSVLKDRRLFSARGAGILGFSIFGKNVTYAFDENMNIDFDVVESFLKKHEGKEILLFGFTFMVWLHLYQELKKSNRKLSLENGILIHGGGWKKLLDQSVDNKTFKKSLNEVTGIKKIYNYYGMVEQTGSIFMECEHGHFHCSIFSDVIIRKDDLSVAPQNEKGLIQLISLLPTSYPGHNILSEDLGTILGEDDCPCGRLGKYFKVHGRVQNAEVRGCSDTYKS